MLRRTSVCTRSAFSGRRNRRPQLEVMEARCLLSGISGYTEYPIPSGNTSFYITNGPDGNLWFTDQQLSGVCDVGMINPTSRAVTEFALPTLSCMPREITAGPDGNLWFAEYANPKIGMVNTTTHAVTEFAYPSSYGHGWGITAGPDGNLWFTTFNNYGAIGTFNLATHAFSFFATPSLNSQPHGIAAGPDGNLWFAEYGPGKVGEINATSHAISEFSLPAGAPNPIAITSGPDGNLWFTISSPDRTTGATWIGAINPTTDAINLFATSGPTQVVTSGPDGNLWFTGTVGLGRINPATGTITQFPVTTGRGVTPGSDGNLWYTDGTKVGVATLATSSLVVSQQPPASVTAGAGFGLAVQAEDSSGNLITSFNGPVTVALANNPDGAILGGTLTVQASGGVANFSGLTLTKASPGYTLYTSGGGFGWGVTDAFAVTPAAASQLVITQQPPSTVKVSTAFGMQAAIEDAYGNVVTTDSGTVSVALLNNPTGATLGGTTTVTASQGVASFTNLMINKVGSGYTLQVSRSGSGLTPATSSSINVTKTGKAPTALTSSAATATSDLSLAPLVLDSPDLWNGLGLKRRSRSI